jgi:hypothetical protein
MQIAPERHDNFRTMWHRTRCDGSGIWKVCW